MGESFDGQLPVRIGTFEQFQRVAATLRAASFDEPTLCRTLKLGDMSDVGQVDEDEMDLSVVSPQLQILIRLFLYQAMVQRREVEAVFDVATIDSFLALGLWGAEEFGDDHFYARVLLYPVGGFFIASDRHSLPDGSPFEPPPDIVFPAIFVGTLLFLDVLPTASGTEALDLCSGTGIAAMVLSRTHERSVSSDITDRAALFARFNCALNERESVEVITGDLFDAVAGQSFDCIVAHPPYVPSIGITTIWRDGGSTGEALIRRIVEGLPDYLRAGGRFCAVTLGLDTKEGNFEARARSWLGDKADEFDILLGCVEERRPADVLKNFSERNATAGSNRVQELEAEFKRQGILKMPYGVLFMRRTLDPATHKPWTVRRRMKNGLKGFDFDAVFSLHDRLSQPDFVSGLMAARPKLAERLQVKVTHVISEGSLVPAEFIFEIDEPFQAAAKFESWMVPLLARLDGVTTLSKIFDEAKERGEIPDDFALEDFCGLVAGAMSLGYIELPADGV